jgi:hypothetical protein
LTSGKGAYKQAQFGNSGQGRMIGSAARRRLSGRVRMEAVMDNFTFGITMLICGMGGTILTLWIMSLVMGLLGKLFPEKPEKKEA